MTFDSTSLSSEPLIYMLMHSGAFVCVLGVIFFFVGLLFGYATWGRYKRQTRQLLGEAEAMKDEIAVLKRKIGDHSIKSGPAVAMATETIHMPKREKEGTNAAEADPAITAETITTQDIRPPVAPPAEAASTKPPSKSRANVITAKAPKPAPPPEVPPAALNGTQAPEAAPPPVEPATDSLTPSDTELPPPARHPSPLAAIIAAPPVKAEPDAVADTPDVPATPEGLILADTLPALTEPPTELPVSPLPELEIQPELDPKLGLIYKTRPATADDLTALKGISRVLEKRLHEVGIYTYAQIAAWDEDRVKEFSARLSFKDRIHREHWVEQAGKLVARPVTA